MTDEGQVTLTETQKVQELHDSLRMESERGKIILMAVCVDDLLLQILKRFLKPPRKKDDKLFGKMRPLASFSARIETAYRLGLISKEMADCYDLLRDIRNDCAHKLTSQGDEQAQRLKTFRKMTGQISSLEPVVEALEGELGTGKDLFIFHCVLHQVLLQSQLLVTERVPDAFMRYKKPPVDQKS